MLPRKVNSASFVDAKKNSFFVRALVFSLVMHLVLLIVEVPQLADASRPVEVTLLQPQMTQEQIVSPPQNKSDKAPENSRLRSDYNSIAEKEQIQRGLPTPAPQPQIQPQISPTKNVKPSPPSPPTKEAATEKQEVKKVTKPEPQSKSNPKLTLNQGDLAKTLAALPKTKNADDYQTKQIPNNSSIEAEREKLKTERKLVQQQPFTQRAFALSNTKPGTPDYLPNIPDGDITLLNVKADQFAVFVRRVANQVFGAIRKRNWQELSFSEAQSIYHFVTVEAVMSADGKLISVKQLDSSGSIKFDEILLSAARSGAWDQNPPKGALASDGNIHFIFKSRTWARRTGDARFEQRWLLLGTGLL